MSDLRDSFYIDTLGHINNWRHIYKYFHIVHKVYTNINVVHKYFDDDSEEIL